MTIHIARRLDENTWRRYVEGQTLGNIFQTPEMFQVFDKAAGHHPALWAAVNDEGLPLALLTVVELTLIPGPLRGFTTRAVAYGGELHDPSLEGESALRDLLQAYGKGVGKDPLFTELRHLSNPNPVRHILQECGYEHQEHLNYLIDLDRSPDAVLQGMGRRTRKQIRRGLRKNIVRVEELHEREHLSLWYNLLQKTYAAAQVPLARQTLFETAFDILYPKGMVKFLVARIGDAPAAVSAELICGTKIYGWYSGLDRAYASQVPNELLMWHILRWGAENGFHLYDFGGAGKPDERYGVRDFKAKFGGELVNFGRDTCAHKPRVLGLSQYGYDIWRRLKFSTATHRD